jgi:hypothetical protein
MNISELINTNSILTVIAIYAENSAILYRLHLGSLLTPGLYKASLFSIECNKIPKSWVINSGVSRGGFDYMSLEPEAWSTPGFWEEYFDQDQLAIHKFDEELIKIINESNTLPNNNEIIHQ